ncbi:hypothetical protein [Candidatus Sororendozoicomonas aggregata]
MTFKTASKAPRQRYQTVNARPRACASNKPGREHNGIRQDFTVGGDATVL